MLTYRDYTRELAMQRNAEIQRLSEAGWTLLAVSPEMEGAVATGQRYVFTFTREPSPSTPGKLREQS